jgi:hypothetical protein
MVPMLSVRRREHARMLGERIFAKRNVVVGRRLHDVSIEDVGVQYSCCVVVVEEGSVFRVGLVMELVMRVVKLVVDGRVCWACLLVREPVACSSKGHAGAEQVTNAHKRANGGSPGGRSQQRRRGAV